MIVRCPSCKQQISSKVAVCPHCGFARGAVSDRDLLEFQRRRLRDRIYHLKMASYGVITVFLAAFGWYWWSTSGFQQKSATGPIVLLAAGTVGYVVVRVLLYLAGRELRKLSSS